MLMVNIFTIKANGFLKQNYTTSFEFHTSFILISCLPNYIWMFIHSLEKRENGRLTRLNLYRYICYAELSDLFKIGTLVYSIKTVI